MSFQSVGSSGAVKGSLLADEGPELLPDMMSVGCCGGMGILRPMKLIQKMKS